MTCPLAAVAAPIYLPLPSTPLVPRVEEASTQLKALLAGSKMPTPQAASLGGKTTSPSAAVVAPPNLLSPLIMEEMSMQLKALLSGSKTPTPGG